MLNENYLISLLVDLISYILSSYMWHETSWIVDISVTWWLSVSIIYVSLQIFDEMQQALNSDEFIDN